MELVYLWVEEYKNIHKQGFNFSPRFHCEFKDEYDEDGKLKENCELVICDKEKNECKDNDYIKDFFGDNINVTAIVGKNGSGKSNLLEALICIVEKKYIPWDNYKICAIFYNQEKDIFLKKDINFHLEIKYKNKATLEDIQEGKKNKYKIFLFHYNYTLDYIENEEHNIDFNKLYHKKDDYNTPVLLQPNKANRKIDSWLMDYLANKDILNFVISKDMSIENFFIPTVCKLDFSFSNIYKNNTYRRILEEKYKEEDINYLTDVSKLTKDDLIYLTRVYIVRKSRERNFNSIKDNDFKKLLDAKIGGTNRLIEYIEDKSFEDLYDVDITHKIKKIQDSFLFIDYIKLQNESYKINSKITISDYKELLLNFAPWIDIEFFNEKNISFNSLSYGQKFLIKFLYSILYQLNNLNSYDKYTDIIILLDEVELGLHPQWQKEYLSLLMSVLQIYSTRYRFNIVCSSHSPFILSDLPKENIIFLKDGKNDIGINHKQTFGANIHTLLSDSFFMEDGLMGEFAKGKINEIIKFHNITKKKRHKKCLAKIYEAREASFRQTQSIVGDPYLKQVLENHLLEIDKFLDKKVAKKKLKARLEKQLAELEDD